MVSATVLIPTHNHAETLRHAIGSVQAQKLQDFEIFIVGDGVDGETRQCIGELAIEEPRIRFFDFPKGPRKGEVHRHAALREATGRFVAYLGDDDLWFPDHLTTVDELLSEADFGHTLHIGLDDRGAPFVFAADLSNLAFCEKMLREIYNRFDFTFGCHTLEAYRRLPRGWDTTPLDFPHNDLYIWRQFLAEPWCRSRTAFVPTALCTHTHLRPHLTNRQRADELAYWRAESSKPEFREILWGLAAENLTRTSVRHELGALAQQKELEHRASLILDWQKEVEHLSSRILNLEKEVEHRSNRILGFEKEVEGASGTDSEEVCSPLGRSQLAIATAAIIPKASTCLASLTARWSARLAISTSNWRI